MAYSDKAIVPQEGTRRAYLLKVFNNELAWNTVELTKFAESIKKDPVQAMRWADGQYLHAAKVSVAQQMVHCLEHCQDTSDITDTLKSNIMGKARYMYNKSTSTSGNLMEECLVAAACEALDKFNFDSEPDNLDTSRL